MHTDLGPVSLIYCRMAGGSGKDGSSKNKSTNKSSNKSINKNIAHNTGAEGGSSMPDPVDYNSTMSRKLDNLLAVVQEMNGQ